MSIPVTSPARTMLDAAPRLPAQAFTRTVNNALHTPHLKRHHLAEIARLHLNHPGAKLLLPFYDTTDGATRSGWEDTFPTWCHTYNLPRPVMAYKIGSHTVDACFVEEQLAIELDGWEFHQERDPFETDRDRDPDNLEHGFPTIRITWKRMEHESLREAQRLHRILAHRRIELAALTAYLSQTVR